MRDKPFHELPFADFLARCRETRSVLDAVRRLEDTAEKPELEQQFFEDLKIWFNEFDKVKWTPPELAAESIILLINKLIFARTIEDFGLVPYRYTQDAYAQHTRDWQAKGPHRIVPKFLAQFEEFFDEYYDTEIFSARVWDRLDKDPANLQRFCDKLNFILGINTWDQTFSTAASSTTTTAALTRTFSARAMKCSLPPTARTRAFITRPPASPARWPIRWSIRSPEKSWTKSATPSAARNAISSAPNKLMAQLFEIRVADTACGSGGFLIKVLRCLLAAIPAH